MKYKPYQFFLYPTILSLIISISCSYFSKSVESAKTNSNKITLIYDPDFSKYTNIHELVIIVTTDVHGNLFPINNFPQYSLAHISAWIKYLESLGKEVIYLDNGDFFRTTLKSSINYFNNTSTDTYHTGVAMLKYMNIRAFTCGNHEFLLGIPFIKKLSTLFGKGVVLSASVKDSQVNEPYLNPYITITSKQGFRLSVLGITTTEIKMCNLVHKHAHIQVNKMIPTAKYFIKKIQDEENANWIVGLFHSGAGNGNLPDETYTHRYQWKHLNICRYMAENIAGFDTIFGGHEHENVLFKTKNKQTEKELFVLTSLDRAVSCSQVTLTIGHQNNNWSVLKANAEIIEIAKQNLSADPQFMQQFSKEIITYESDMNDPKKSYLFTQS